MLIKILGVGICTVVLSLVLKQARPEISLLASVCGGLLIFMLVMEGVGEIASELILLSDMTGEIEIVKPVMKVLGVGYITEFTANLAEDSGNKSVASKIILGGKVAICTLAFPILKQLVQTILSLI